MKLKKQIATVCANITFIKSINVIFDDLENKNINMQSFLICSSRYENNLRNTDKEFLNLDYYYEVFLNFFAKSYCGRDENPYLHGPLTGEWGWRRQRKKFVKVVARVPRSGKVGGVERVDVRWLKVGAAVL